jgi:hypothetical protein
MAENINPKIIMVILNEVKDLVIEYKSKILRPEQVAGLRMTTIQ